MNTNAYIDKIFHKMIISASGWRGVFTESGDEESAEAGISREHRIIASLAAKVFSDYLKAEAPEKNTGSRTKRVVS